MALAINVPARQSRKFYRPWRGPFEVIEVLSPPYCVLRDPDDPNAAEFTAHFNKLKVYSADDPSTDTQDYLNVTRSFSESYLQPIPDPSDDPSKSRGMHLLKERDVGSEVPSELRLSQH